LWPANPGQNVNCWSMLTHSNSGKNVGIQCRTTRYIPIKNHPVWWANPRDPTNPNPFWWTQ
jgi:hypothetical protein